MLILGIETSCDETAAAVVDEEGKIRANIINSQVAIHAQFGGIVPEVASRQHLKNILPIVERCLEEAGVSLADIDLIAATRGPGLVGALLVGYTFALALARGRDIPIVGVDHLQAHILAVFLGPPPHPAFPFIATLVSGGHTAIFLVRDPMDISLMGTTLDDAAGEAFDKVAKVLDLGYPGGPVISKLARSGDPAAISFPRPLLRSDDLNFSFSGLKTAVITEIKKNRGHHKTEDVCAAFQEAAIEVICAKTLAAARETGINDIVVAGGVAANPRLRRLMADTCETAGRRLFLPPADLCPDNGAMIAHGGYHTFKAQGPTDISTDVYSRAVFHET